MLIPLLFVYFQLPIRFCALLRCFALLAKCRLPVGLFDEEKEWEIGRDGAHVCRSARTNSQKIILSHKPILHIFFFFNFNARKRCPSVFFLSPTSPVRLARLFVVVLYCIHHPRIMSLEHTDSYFAVGIDVLKCGLLSIKIGMLLLTPPFISHLLEGEGSSYTN